MSNIDKVQGVDNPKYMLAIRGSISSDDAVIVANNDAHFIDLIIRMTEHIKPMGYIKDYQQAITVLNDFAFEAGFAYRVFNKDSYQRYIMNNNNRGTADEILTATKLGWIKLGRGE